MGGHLSLRTSWVLLVVAACVSALPGHAAGGDDALRRDQPIEITADRIVYESVRQVYVAQGEVRVVQDDRRIDADWIVFNRITRRGIAAGNVRAADGDDVLEARFLEFDNAAQQGLVLTGRLDLGEDDFRFAAGELVKTSAQRFEAKDVSMTTCRCPEDDDRLPWVINADEADVEIGGYATVTNSTLDVLGVPAIWLPWAAFPIKTERATGFLPPQFRFGGGNGFEVALPFFWAARDNVNVTLTPRYMTTRGFKPELLVETVYGRRSSTDLFASFIHDMDPDEISGSVPNPTPPPATLRRDRNQYNPNRFGVGFDNDIHLPGGLRLRSDIQVVSDNEYVRDFEEFRDFRMDRFIESTAFGFGHVGRDGSGGGVLSVTYRNDRQNPDRSDRDKYLLHRAPSAELAWLPTRVDPLAGFAFGMNVDYANFWSYKRASDELELTPTSGGIQGDDRYLDIGIASLGGGVFTDPDQREKLGVDDGVFQEGEPLNDKGHRFILNPHIGHSFRLFDAVDLRPEVGWHQTLYSTDAQSFEDRGLLTARVDAQSQLRGRVDPPLLPPLVHLLEPKVSWAYVWKRSQSSNPLFVPATKVPQRRIRQLSLDNVVLDDADRIDPANIVSVGAGNRFYIDRRGGRRLLGELEFSLAYDFRGGRGDPGLAIAEGRLLPYRGIVSSFNVAYDMDKTRFEQAYFEVAFPLKGVLGLRRSSGLALGYRYRQAVGTFFESFESIQGVDDVGGSFSRLQSEFTRINQVTAATRLRFTENWAVDYSIAYSLHRTTMLTNRGALEYTSKCRCWAVQLLAEDNRTRGLRFGINITLLGAGSNLDNPFQGNASSLGTGMF